MKGIRLFFEKFHPHICSVVVGTILFLLPNSIFDKIVFKDLSSSATVVFSVLLGFLLTVSTLLNTIENDFMKVIKENNDYKRLLRYLQTGIYISIAVSFISLIVPITRSLYPIFEYFPFDVIYLLKRSFLILLTFALAAVIRFINIFFLIINN